MLFDDIVCRAQRKDNGEWIEGYYFCLHHNDERTHIHHMLIPVGADLSLGTPIEKIQVEVIPESIKLKNQEPHVITEDDFSQCDDFGYIPAVFEPRDMSTFVSWEWSLICDSAIRYRKDGRYWSGVPTNEQTEETPWNQ